MLFTMGDFPSLYYTALIFYTGTHNMNWMGKEGWEGGNGRGWDGKVGMGGAGMG